MPHKYTKVFSKGKKLFLYIFLIILVITCNLIDFIDSIASEVTISKLRLSILGATFLLECFGILYSIFQDISKAKQEASYGFDKKKEHSIPFVDREELLDDILKNVSRKIEANGYYYVRNIRYGVRNGKTALADKLCCTLQQIKDVRGTELFKRKIAKKIGNIFLVDYSTCAEYPGGFEAYIKKNFVYIRGKINIIVVINAYEELCIWTDTLKDRDVFFVFLNFNIYSEDALFFADDKIAELLFRLQNFPAFTPIFENKSEAEIREMAATLGRLSNNNIGMIVDLLRSNEFTLLIQTDAAFLDFYLAIKHGHYDAASYQYNNLPTPPVENPVYKYKLRYEHANLVHFLGLYNDAYSELEQLQAEICCDKFFQEKTLGKSLYFDIILLQAHTLKHCGNFDAAINTLRKVEENQKNNRWLRAHFSTHILQLNEIASTHEEWHALLSELMRKMQQFKANRVLQNSDYYFYEVYYPIAHFYDSKFNLSKIPALIAIENEAITYYEKHERRYLTNCYFIKAELLRINSQWKEAEEYYSRCYNIYCHNGDKDILYLVAIVCAYLENFEGISLEIPFDYKDAIADCKLHDGYGFHQRLISRLELAQYDNNLRNNLLRHFRTTINPIP